MKHWKELSTAEKAEAITGVYNRGASCADMAAVIEAKGIEGVTANAIIGMYSRYRSLRANYPLRDARDGPASDPILPKRTVRTPPKRTWTEDDPFPGALRLSLLELTSVDCRWIVSGAGEKAVFCGCRVAAGSPYCPHHRERNKGKRVVM